MDQVREFSYGILFLMSEEDRQVFVALKKKNLLPIILPLRTILLHQNIVVMVSFFEEVGE